MKNKMVRGLVMTGMACMLLTACGSKEQADTAQTADVEINVEITDMAVTQEADTVAEPVAEIAEESTPKAEAVTLTDEEMVIAPLDDETAMLQSYSGDAESIIIPEEINGRKITVIGEEAFVNEEQLKSIVIPDTVTEIGSGAFMNCDNLDYVVMSKNIEKIGERAFLGPNYYNIELPDTLKELGEGAFSNCKFSELNIPKGLDSTGVYTFPNNRIEILVIPDNIKKIQEEAFRGCKQLKTVIIEEGVEIIEEDAFRDCVLLESVTIPASVTEMTDPFYDSPNVTIYTPAGSYAETWAAENGVPCVAQ